VGDIGNNPPVLPLRVIHRIDEPDPMKPSTGPLRVTASSYYRFPSPKERFDAESLLIEGGRAILISKRLDHGEAELFSVPIDPPAPLLRPAVPERLGTLPEFVEPATGADLLSDGKRLAVCAMNVTRVYERTPTKGWRLTASVRYESDQIEAIAWDGRDLVLASENRGVFRITERQWSPSPRPTVRP
jgi:hypothetical protein